MLTLNNQFTLLPFSYSNSFYPITYNIPLFAVDVLGNSKSVYDIKLSRTRVEEDERQLEIRKLEIAAMRAEHKAKTGGSGVDGGDELEGSYNRDAMKIVIDKLSQAAYTAIKTRSLKPLNASRTRVSPKEFKVLLLELNCDLNSREQFLLERRYYYGQTGTVDINGFRTEFIAVRVCVRV